MNLLRGVGTSDQSMEDFLESLRKEGLVKGNEMTLPHGISFAGDESRRGKLLVRVCYRKLSDLIFEMAGISESEEHHIKRKHRRFVIQGNPGIGKTLFSYYLIYRLMQKKKTIVWQPSATKNRILITPEAIEFGKILHDFKKQLDVGTTWYIVHANLPARVNAKTVLICSPQRELVKEFEKQGANMLYMPVWTWKEIELAQQLGLARSSGANGEPVSPEDVREQFRLWGGIPRYVFERAGDKNLLTALDSAIAVTDLKAIVTMMGEVRYADSTTLKLVHVAVETEEGPDRFFLFKLYFASCYVEEQIVDKFVKERKVELFNFLLGSKDLKRGVNLRGVIFEGYVHHLLVQRGKYQVRRLQRQTEGPTTVTEIELDNSTEKRFDELSQVSAQQEQENVYWRPQTFTGIDVIMLPDMLFLITVKRDHPVKKRVIEEAAKRLLALQTEEDANMSESKRRRLDDSPCVIRLYFVVPWDMFDDYRQQHYLDSWGKLMANGIDGDVLRVDQYVLGVPLKSV